MKGFLRSLAAAVAALEGPLLVFPVLVIEIVAATFLFPGGRCGAWQWWLAVAGTVAWAYGRAGNRRSGIAAAGGFLAVLGFLWLLSNATVVEARYDMLRCHVPAVRLLIGGWNPVWGGTPEGIQAATGVDPSSLYALHAVSMPRGVWYFAAAAWFFAGNPHNLLFPLLPLLLAGTALVLLDAFRGLPRTWRILAVAALAGLMPDWTNPLDAALDLCAIGLLASFRDWLRGGRWNALRIGAFTVLMAVAKPNGLLQAMLFWAIAAILGGLRGRIRPCRRPVLCTGLLAVALVVTVVTSSPLISPWGWFSHPFQSLAADDGARIQAEKLTADFLDRNEDAAAMGHVGAWFNAHVSPGLVRAFYRARTGREDFFPESLTWGQAIHEPGTPTTAGWRLAFCTLLLLLLAGGRGGRFVALCLLAATWTLPTEMLGYRRYVPWTFSAAVFGLPLLHAALGRLRVPHRAADLAAAAGALLLLAPVALRMAYRVDDAHAILLLETRTPSPACVVAADLDPGQSIPPGIPEPALGANLLLLAREDPWIARAACPPDGASAADLYARFPANGLAVSPDCDVAAASARHRLFALPDRRARLAATPRFLLSTAFVTLPDTLRLCVPRLWPRTARAPASGERDGAGERKDGRDGGEAA
ncbi:MAG: hypothetical protein IKO01_03390 [Kiritimatiellae bacterium]|nr:hypothetical protein [Kiritimatiellia bacterium]